MGIGTPRTRVRVNAAVINGPEIHVIKLPDLLGPEWRAEQDRKREETRRRYLEHLVSVLAAAEFPNDVEEQAVAVLDALFVWEGVQTGERCRCSCHPRLPEGDQHDSGFDCPCRRTADEHRARFDQWKARMDEFWASPEGRRITAEHQAEEDELEAWLAGHPEVVVTRHGGMAPEQWWGEVDGHTFYFRERHDHWRIELDLRPSGRFYRAWAGGDLDDDANYELRESDEGDVIAEGTTRDDHYGRTPVERIQFIVDTVRAHLRPGACTVHTDERADLELLFGRPLAWCPACGVRLP